LSTRQIRTVTGRITHIGPHTLRSARTDYSLIEVETDAGRVDLPQLHVDDPMVRLIEIGRSVSLAVVQDKAGKPGGALVGAHDHATGRTFTDRNIVGLSAKLKWQAIALSLAGVFFVPLGLMLFVYPGAAMLRIIYDAWSQYGEWPADDVLSTTITGLSTLAPAAAA
jgi:hypothetical protein